MRYTLKDYGTIFGQAIDLVYRGEDEEALSKIAILERLGPKNEFPQILKSWSLCGLGRFQESVVASNEAVQLINNSRHLNFDEKNYLTAYVSDIYRIAAKHTDVPAQEFWDGDFSKINLHNVNKNLLSKFPLKIHPDWVGKSS